MEKGASRNGAWETETESQVGKTGVMDMNMMIVLMEMILAVGSASGMLQAR